MLFALAAYRLSYGRAIMGATLVVTLVGWLVVLQVMYFRQTMAVSLEQLATYEFLRSVSHNELPIVVSNPHTFMKLVHYAPQDLASRLVYLADPEASLRSLGHNTVDRGMLDLKPWFQLNVSLMTATSCLSNDFWFMPGSSILMEISGVGDTYRI